MNIPPLPSTPIERDVDRSFAFEWTNSSSVRVGSVYTINFSTCFNKPILWRLSMFPYLGPALFPFLGPVFRLRFFLKMEEERREEVSPMLLQMTLRCQMEQWSKATINELNGFQYMWEPPSCCPALEFHAMLFTLTLRPQDREPNLQRLQDPQTFPVPYYGQREDLELLSRHLGEMYNNASFSDLVLRSRSGEIFNLHKFILHSRVPNIYENFYRPRLVPNTYIMDAIMEFCYKADLTRCLTIFQVPQGKKELYRAIHDYAIWRLYQHLTPPYQSCTVNTITAANTIEFEVTFDSPGEVTRSYARWKELTQDINTVQGPKSITFIFDLTLIQERLHLRVQIRLAEHLYGTGCLHVSNPAFGRRTLQREIRNNFQDFDYGRIMPSGVLLNRNITINCIFVLNGALDTISIEPTPRNEEYPALTGLSVDMRNAHIAKIDPDCKVFSENGDFIENVHAALVRHRLGFEGFQGAGENDGNMKEYVSPFSEEATKHLMAYMYFGKYKSDLRSQVIDELRNRAAEEHVFGPLLRQWIETLDL